MTERKKSGWKTDRERKDGGRRKKRKKVIKRKEDKGTLVGKRKAGRK